MESRVAGGGRPVVEADHASAAELDILLTRYGAVLLRRCFAPSLLAALTAAAETLFREREELKARGQLTGKMERQYARNSLDYRDLKPRFPSEMDELLHPQYVGMATRYLNGQPQPSHITSIRRMVPGGNRLSMLPFHQDQAVIGRPTLNLWVALSPCGRDAPRLEVVLTDRTELLPTHCPEDIPFATNRLQIEETLVASTFGIDALWHPEFAAGDAMVFKGTTVHRTYKKPEMSSPRLNAEMRLL